VAGSTMTEGPGTEGRHNEERDGGPAGQVEVNRGSAADLPLWVSVHLAAMGVRDLVIGVLPGNTAAIRLYQRRGFRPTWSYLSRFAGR
jgi:hypothetical protein